MCKCICITESSPPAENSVFFSPFDRLETEVQWYAETPEEEGSEPSSLWPRAMLFPFYMSMPPWTGEMCPEKGVQNSSILESIAHGENLKPSPKECFSFKKKNGHKIVVRDCWVSSQTYGWLSCSVLYKKKLLAYIEKKMKCIFLQFLKNQIWLLWAHISHDIYSPVCPSLYTQPPSLTRGVRIYCFVGWHSLVLLLGTML